MCVLELSDDPTALDLNTGSAVKWIELAPRAGHLQHSHPDNMEKKNWTLKKNTVFLDLDSTPTLQ